jgi:hypothetical protein
MTIFKLDQSNDAKIQSAQITIPGCGNNKVKGGSTLAAGIEEGKIILLVFGDINSSIPTYEIGITGALEVSRTRLTLGEVEHGE